MNSTEILAQRKNITTTISPQKEVSNMTKLSNLSDMSATSSMIATDASTTKAIYQDWGRISKVDYFLSIGSLCMMALVPFFVAFCLQAVANYNGSMLDCACAIFNHLSSLKSLSDLNVLNAFVPITKTAFQLWASWMLLQIALWYLVPGPIAYGQLTPAGNLLKYRVNGLNVYFTCHAIFGFAVWMKWFSPTVVYREWLSLNTLANVFGFSLTIFAYVKACYFPTHANDCKFTGSFLYDMFMGAECNPRLFGDSFDFKLFFNGRPGICGWTLINLCFAYAQWDLHGKFTNAMIMLNILQAFYVIDFFKHESWYLRTIDICHDHFGFYLAWGDSVFLPFAYTFQAYYLVSHPEIEFSAMQSFAIMLLGCSGYTLFRLTNWQKDSVRQHKGQCNIWGKPAKFIRTEYYTSCGSKRESLLLTSGFWSLARHFNYCCDLMLSLSFCLCCGFQNLLPYFYIIYMTILLVHRTSRDDTRCRAKYGKFWTQYCDQVKYKIIPGIW